jgi:hypothetical protein
MSFERITRASGAALGFLVVSGLFAALAVGLKLSQPVTAIDADRAAERSKALTEIQVAEENSLAAAATLDAQRGIVRLPIDTAMQLAAQAWKNPAAARADLNSRADKAAAELPKAPEKPSAFE